MTTFVDGHNLMFAASRRIPGLDVHLGEAARDQLIRILSSYRLARSGRIVVFFDSGPGGENLPRRQMVRGIDVVYSDIRSDADTEIKSAVSHDSNPREVRVVTSDAKIRDFVKRFGATVTSSEEFINELLAAGQEEESPPTDEPIEKYEGGAGDDKDYWLRAFGEKKP